METQQLLKNCIKGKKEAQLQLYQQYAAAMLGVCYLYTKSIEDAEDVLQEGFIKVFTRLHQFKQQGNIGAWIRRIMVNTAIDYLNKHKRYKNEMRADDPVLHPVTDENPEIKMDTKQLVEMIQQLPAGYQVIFNLIAVEGYEHAEVSKLLDMNINTVRSKYSRARMMLIMILKKNALSETRNYEGKI